MLKAAAAVTAPSSYLLEEMGSYRSDLKQIPNGIELNAYRFRRRERPYPRLLWLRAFHAIYNPSLAPRVVALLAKDFPEVRLTMVGPDKGDGSWEATHRIAGELGVLDRIQWPGGVPKTEVPSILDAADIFLNTTNIDNAPVSVIEALACGLCVVSTDVGGLSRLLTHEENALLVHGDDAPAMATAVSRILREPGLAAHLSSSGRRLAENSDWSRVLPDWERLLTDVMEEGCT